MILQPPSKAPERILLYGDAGSGKSTAALTIAHTMGATETMRVVDTDYSASWFRSLASPNHSEFADRVQVEVVGPADWKGQLKAVRDAAAQTVEGDWLVLDSATPCWQAIQTLYITMKHGDDFFDFFATNGSKDNDKTDADINWQAVNGEFAKLYDALFTCKGNLLLTAEADAVGDRDDRKVRGLYQTIGFKPKGQKTLAYTPHTVLFMSKARTGEFRMTTIKDREREEIENVTVADFGRDYLMKIAGWRPKKAG